MRRQAFVNTDQSCNNSKYAVVKNAILETYKFINKLRRDSGDSVAELIIVPFDNIATIYSTIKLVDSTNTTIKEAISFDRIKRVIEEELCPCNGTDFESINKVNVKLDECIQQYITDDANIQIIKYIMSDGCHNNKKNCTRDDLLQFPAHTYDYSLGIGKGGAEYDEELLCHMGQTFINGNNSTVIEESIIGDAFNCTNVLATDLQISIITTTADISCSYDVIKTEPFTNTFEFDECDNFKINTAIDAKNNSSIIKLTGKIADRIATINKKIIFVFYVDKSGSMTELIAPCDDSASIVMNIPVDVDTIPDKHSYEIISSQEENVEGEIVEGEIDLHDIVDEELPSIHSSKRPRDDDIIYHRHVLEIIPKFNMLTEMFAVIPSMTNIVIELSYTDMKGDKVIKYMRCNSNEIMDPNEIDMMSKCCHLRDKLRELANAPKEHRKRIATALNELVRCPLYNRIIADQTNLSSTKAFLFGIVENIKNVTIKALGKSEIMFNNLLRNMTDNITRTTSCTQSRVYSSCVSSPSTTTDISDIMTCVICQSGKREVIYDCGHCISCKRCTKQIFFDIDEEVELSRLPSDIFANERVVSTNGDESAIIDETLKKCPVCIKKVRNVRLLLIHDHVKSIRCNETGCDNIAKYVSHSCGHLTYCGRCIIGKTKCPCGIEMSKLQKAYF